MAVDVGCYHDNAVVYQRLADELYEKYGSITLPPEYNYFLQDNCIQWLIRLSRYKFVARLLKKTDNILEVGCGSGMGSLFLSQHCAHVVGLDVKTTEVEEARSITLRNNVTFIVGDLFELDGSNKWDVIVALDVIEHMPLEEGRKLVSSISKLLKTNGTLILGTPSIYSYEYQGALSKASHVKCYDQQELLNLVDNFFGRTIAFSMNDEVVHTGHPKMAWYYFILAFYPITT